MTAGTEAQPNGIIIKEVKSHRDLADYLPKMTDEQFEQLTHYLEPRDDGRGSKFRAINFVAPTLPGILAEMRTLQFQTKSKRRRTVYHLISAAAARRILIS